MSSFVVSALAASCTLNTLEVQRVNCSSNRVLAAFGKLGMSDQGMSGLRSSALLAVGTAAVAVAAVGGLSSSSSSSSRFWQLLLLLHTRELVAAPPDTVHVSLFDRVLSKGVQQLWQAPHTARGEDPLSTHLAAVAVVFSKRINTS